MNCGLKNVENSVWIFSWHDVKRCGKVSFSVCVCARACARTCSHACVCVCFAITVVVSGLKKGSCTLISQDCPLAMAFFAASSPIWRRLRIFGCVWLIIITHLSEIKSSNSEHHEFKVLTFFSAKATCLHFYPVH